jgi:hypothetical protein
VSQTKLSRVLPGQKGIRPVSIGVSGHRGLPADTVIPVADAVHDAFAAYKSAGLVGVRVPAHVGDRLLAETILPLGDRFEVIVRAPDYRDGLRADYRATYDHVLAQASELHRLRFVELTEGVNVAGGMAIRDAVDALAGWLGY